MPFSRKRSLSGMALEMMKPGIEFGPHATADVFDRMYTAAAELDRDTLLLGKVSAGRVMEAIDALLPVVDGRRQVTDKLNMANFLEDQIEQKPAWVIGTIQNDVWMKFDDEMPSFLSVTPKEIWLAIQHLEYLGDFEPIEAGPEKITVAGKDFVSHECQVKIHSAAGTPIGELFEMTSTTAVMPQYFARMEDGALRDLRNDNYAVVDLEDAQAEPDETPELG